MNESVTKLSLQCESAYLLPCLKVRTSESGDEERMFEEEDLLSLPPLAPDEQ